jgi:hypothetical protein
MDSEAGGPCDGMYVASCPATCNTCNGACTTTETTSFDVIVTNGNFLIDNFLYGGVVDANQRSESGTVSFSDAGACSITYPAVPDFPCGDAPAWTLDLSQLSPFELPLSSASADVGGTVCVCIGELPRTITKQK